MSTFRLTVQDQLQMVWTGLISISMIQPFLHHRQIRQLLVGNNSCRIGCGCQTCCFCDKEAGVCDNLSCVVQVLLRSRQKLSMFIQNPVLVKINQISICICDLVTRPFPAIGFL